MVRLLAVLSVALAGSAACTGDVTVHLAPPWSKDQLVVLVALDGSGGARDTELRVYDGAETIELDLPEGGPSRLLARSYPRTLTGPDGTPALDCDIAINGATPLPAPEQTWVTPLLDQDSIDVSFSLDDDDRGLNVPFGFNSCARMRDCAGYSAKALTVEPNIRTNRVSIIDPTLAYFVGERDGAGDLEPAVIGKIEAGDQVTILPPVDGILGSPDGLAWDPRGILWVLTTAIPKKYTRDFSPLPYQPLNRIRSINLTGDGAMFIVSKDGEVYTETSTGGFAIDRAFPPDAGRMRAVWRDRLFIHASSAIWAWDGVAWRNEWNVPLLENVSAIGGDDDVTVIAGELELVRIRNEVDRTWERKLERPWDSGLRIRAAEAIGGGRFLVAGDSGAVAAWTGDDWCPLGFFSTATLVDIAVDPTRRYAYVVAANQVGTDGQTVLLRVDMPAP